MRDLSLGEFIAVEVEAGWRVTDVGYDRLEAVCAGLMDRDQIEAAELGPCGGWLIGIPAEAIEAAAGAVKMALAADGSIEEEASDE